MSLWAGVLCNHTHTHPEDSPQECRVGRRRLAPRQVHTPTQSSHTAFFTRPLVRPSPLRSQRRGLPQVTLLVSCFFIGVSPPPPRFQQIVQYHRSAVSPGMCFYIKTSPLLHCSVFHWEHTWQDLAQRPCSSLSHTASPGQPNFSSLLPE